MHAKRRQSQGPQTSDLVIGGSGFIGAAVLHELLAQGRPVRTFLREQSPLAPGLARRVDIFRGNAGDRAQLRAALQDVETVFNCAGHSADWGAWSTFQTANADNVAALLGAAQDVASVQRIVHFSTLGVYGQNRNGARDARTTLPYRRSKIMAETYFEALPERTGLSCVILRPGTVIGPGAKDWCVAIAEALENGTFTFIANGTSVAGFVNVFDLARAAVALTQTQLPRTPLYLDVVDPEPITWRAYIEAMSEALDLRVPRRNLPVPLAMALAVSMETTSRLLGRENRPLLTRHLVDLFSSDRRFDPSEVRALVPDVEWEGAWAAIAASAAWVKDARRGRS